MEDKKMQISPAVRSRVVGTATLKNAFAGLLLFTTVIAVPAWAALVPTNEFGMDEIFGVGNFGDDTIDIRFNPQIEFEDAPLLNIGSESSWLSLIGNGFGLANNVVRMFFVDSITWCGSTSTGLAGCGSEPGNDIAIDIDFADASFGDVLYAHELGHNLGLGHDSTSGNLMRGNVASGNLNLTAMQVNDVLLDPSSIIQLDGALRFIEITPVLVIAAATAVPLPGALVLCLGAIGSLGAFGGLGRRTAA
jgi:hypothetical protein